MINRNSYQSTSCEWMIYSAVISQLILKTTTDLKGIIDTL